MVRRERRVYLCSAPAPRVTMSGAAGAPSAAAGLSLCSCSQQVGAAQIRRSRSRTWNESREALARASGSRTNAPWQMEISGSSWLRASIQSDCGSSRCRSLSRCELVREWPMQTPATSRRAPPMKSAISQPARSDPNLSDPIHHANFPTLGRQHPTDRRCTGEKRRPGLN